MVDIEELLYMYLDCLLLHASLETLPEPAEPALVPLVLVHRAVPIKSARQNTILFKYTHQCSIKRQSHENFEHFLFHELNPPRHLMNRIKW